MTTWATRSIPHVVIVGGGFAGLRLARALATRRCEITLLDRDEPPPVPAPAVPGGDGGPVGARHRGADAAHPAPAGATSPCCWARWPPSTRRGKRVRARRRAGPRLRLPGASPAAPRHAYFGHDDWAAHRARAEDARRCARDPPPHPPRVRAAEARSRCRPRAALADVRGRSAAGRPASSWPARSPRSRATRWRGEFRRIDPRSARVLLLEAGPRVLAAFPRDAVGKRAPATRKARRRGAHRRAGHRRSTPSGVQIGDERHRRAHRAVGRRRRRFAAGRSSGRPARPRRPRRGANRTLPCPGIRRFSSPATWRGCSRTASRCRASRRPPSRWARTSRPRSARACAASRRRAVPLPRLRQPRHHRPHGRRGATCGGCSLSGLLAWWFWLAAHIFFLIGFRNRIVGADRLGMGVLELPARRADHRRLATTRMLGRELLTPESSRPAKRVRLE